MAEFKRKAGESFESFMRKFKRGLKNSKKMEKAKSKQYLAPKKTKRLVKQRALVGLSLQKRNEILRRTGKLPESKRH